MGYAVRWDLREHLGRGWFFLRWLGICFPLGVAVGTVVAFFLWALGEVTELRWGTTMGNGLPWLLYGLPLGGVLIVWMYGAVGKSVEAGNNLIMDEIHEPGGGGDGAGGVPVRMMPLVLIGTVLTHLFGGSAGREGTAVQMGGSMASALGRLLRLNKHDVRLVLMAGVAAGFGAVFGTPLAGAVFAMEVVAVGRMNYEAIVPCLMASIIGDRVCGAWGIHHVAYSVKTLFREAGFHEMPSLDWKLAGKVAVAAVAFGLASVVFVELTHGLGRMFKRIRWPLVRPLVGGGIVIVLALLVGRDYLGLGVTAPEGWKDVTILSCFDPHGTGGGAGVWSWWWKILFTAVTLSCGFKGGEVTPLFFVGAALGNVLVRDGGTD